MYVETFTMPVFPPFRLDLTAWTLRRRAKNAIDQWDGKQYRRVLVVDNAAVQVLVEQNTESELAITLKSERPSDSAWPEVEGALHSMFSVHRDLSAFYQIAAQDAHLHALAQAFKGVRPPRFPTIF